MDIFGKIEPKIDQIRAWLSCRHRWAPGFRNHLKISVTGLSLLVNCYLEIKFHKKNRVNPPPPLIQHGKNRGTGLVQAKPTGTGPNSTGTGNGPEFRSGPSVNTENSSVFHLARRVYHDQFIMQAKFSEI